MLNTEIFDKAHNQAKLKLFKEYCYDEMIENEEIDWSNCVPNYALKKFLSWKQKRAEARGARWRYGMVTVNFKPGADHKQIVKKTEKMMKKKWIIDHGIRFECRNEDMEGIHVHAWFEVSANKNIYRTKGEFINTMKDLIGNRQHVHVIYSNEIKKFKNYVNGFKKGQKKPNYDVDEKLNELLLK